VQPFPAMTTANKITILRILLLPFLFSIRAHSCLSVVELYGKND
jgi:hypothetical protein